MEDQQPAMHTPKRRVLENLDVEISFLEGLVRRDPEFVEALQILGDGYSRRGRLLEGLQVDKRLTELCPEDPIAHYNLACSLSLTQQIEEAFRVLDQAITLGYRDFKWLSRDPDLQGLRQHPHFEKIQARVDQMRVQVM